MLDPFPIAPPPFLIHAVKPLSNTFDLHSLPLHIHEILFAALLYLATQKFFSPWISNLLAPRTYAGLSRRARINWDVHVVSFVQSLIICSLSLYILFFDEERNSFKWDGLSSGGKGGGDGNTGYEQRIWAYYGSGGLVQSMALGYFLWDLWMCSLNVEVFGYGMLAHAVSAVSVFSLGYVRISIPFSFHWSTPSQMAVLRYFHALSDWTV